MVDCCEQRGVRNQDTELAKTFHCFGHHSINLGFIGNIGLEPTADHLTRTATLLPALLLARVDGKSPVEYLDPAQQGFVRDFALRALARRSDSLSDVRGEWREAVRDTPWRGAG